MRPAQQGLPFISCSHQIKMFTFLAWVMVTCRSCLQELTEAASETVATTVTTETSTMVTESNEGTKIKEEVTETVTTVTATTTSSTVETTISGIKGKIHEFVCTRKLFREDLGMSV